jgi:hypothetical protein
MKIAFHPRRVHRKLWTRPIEQNEVKDAIAMIMEETAYDKYPTNIPKAYFGDDLITPRVLIREGYLPVDHDCLFGPWYMSNGAGPVPYDAVVYDLVRGG